MHRSIDIISPAVCMDLTVLATAKTELGIASTDTSQDVQIATLIKQASSIVSAYCDQVFGQETVEETIWYDAPYEWARSFELSRDHVTGILSVEIDGTVLDPSEYRLATDGYVHRLNAIGGGSCLWAWTQEAIITYTAGYALLDSLPYGIERATLALIKASYFSIGSDPQIRSEDIPGVRSVTYMTSGGSSGSAGTLPSDVTALLAPYKRLVFA